MLLPSLRLPKQPELTDSVALYPWDEGLARKYSLTTRFGDPYALYSRRGEFIEIPRAVCPVGKIDHRVLGTPIDVRLRLGPKNQQQVDLLNQAIPLWRARESFILSSPTGSGKTYMGAAAVATVSRKTLVVVPKEDLMDQWHEALSKFLGLKPHEIGIIQASKTSVSGKKVIMGMIHSVAMQNRYDPSIFADLGLIIFDECHRCPADSLSGCFRNLPALIRLGLSATVARSDGKEQLVYAHIGPIRVQGESLPMVPKVLTFQSEWKVPRVVRRDPVLKIPKVVQLPHSAGRLGHVITSMVNDPVRNDLLASVMALAHGKGRLIVAFTDSLDHIETMAELLRIKGVPMRDIGRYVGGMSKEAREASKVKKIMLATWGMMKEGTDVPWMDTAAFLTPRSDVEQAAGRVLRDYPNKREPLILDFIDADSKVLANYAQKRRAWYDKIGAKVSAA